jgi:hypothetical protein
MPKHIPHRKTIHKCTCVRMIDQFLKFSLMINSAETVCILLAVCCVCVCACVCKFHNIIPARGRKVSLTKSAINYK